MLMFSLVTPTGIAVGSLLEHSMENLVTSVIQAFAAGVFPGLQHEQARGCCVCRARARLPAVA